MSDGQTVQRPLKGLRFTRGQQAALLCCNYVPFLHTAVVVGVACLPWAPWGCRAGAAVAVLYLFPPVIARCIQRLWPVREGRIEVPSRDYFVWWLVLNLQMVFCRLPALEEVLRLIPGAYSTWLRLWGARIGLLTYWAAGVRVLDRSYLEIGDNVVFGAGVRINPHVVSENADGQMELQLATVHIGDGVVVGGYALLTAGTRIADGEVTKACLISPPFSCWEGGRRVERNAVGKT